MSADRYRYFRTLKITDGETAKLRRALHRAYELRTFEIELYWKRATYFWGFQVAIFAALGLLWREITGPTPSEWYPVAALLCGLGVLTASGNVLSACGSRFWQKNWERHIDALEGDIEGNLHKTVWLEDGKASFSVSRLNEGLGVCLIVFWILIFFFAESKLAGRPSPAWLNPTASGWIGALIILVLALIGAGLLWFKRSKLRGSFPDESGSHGARIKVSPWTGRVSQRGSPTFILRYAPHEERQN